MILLHLEVLVAIALALPALVAITLVFLQHRGFGAIPPRTSMFFALPPRNGAMR